MMYYEYDPNTGEFIGDVIADYSEENPMPDNVTDKPPLFPTMYDVRFIDNTWVETGSAPEPDIEQVRAAKLAENSKTCGGILEHGFQSAVHGDGLQPYRMNGDDQANILGYIAMISLSEDKETLPLFEWKNANQTSSEATWHYAQILDLFMEFGAWKAKILKRQDEIKEQILNAGSADEVAAVEIDYTDLLMFDGGESE
jgi:hypothetical protein